MDPVYCIDPSGEALTFQLKVVLKLIQDLIIEVLEFEQKLKIEK
jgi:hypothetical protein